MCDINYISGLRRCFKRTTRKDLSQLLSQQKSLFKHQMLLLCFQVVDGGEVFTHAYIQHNPQYRSHLDHMVKLTCFLGVRPNAPGSWDITVNDA